MAATAAGEAGEATKTDSAAVVITSSAKTTG
eukprot:CAMPEP_0119088842 /NCGR_PEP_ID=MMETSP1178-20130426/146936_1 /TAXON_ID=33656 /ORGANISM="unid sp, Strain CCMP2000" /LENGTH=30 /DNA_ID= /DNA_START= /DNA_END= /DNA_ORIENTATION=